MAVNLHQTTGPGRAIALAPRTSRTTRPIVIHISPENDARKARHRGPQVRRRVAGRRRGVPACGRDRQGAEAPRVGGRVGARRRDRRPARRSPPAPPPATATASTRRPPTLRARYREILSGLVAGRGAARKEVAAEIDRSFDELERLLSSLVVLKELTAAHARLHRQPRRAALGAAVRGGARRAAGLRARYVDATEVVFTDGPFGGASPNLMLTDLAARKALRPLLRGRDRAGRPGLHRRATDDRDGDHAHATHAATTTRARGDARPRRLRSDRDAAGARAGRARDLALEGRARSAHRRSARRARRARHPAAARARGGGAGLLRRQGAAPARADPGRRAARSRSSCARSPTPTAAGTEISARRTLDRYPVKALSAVGGQALLTVAGNGMLGVPGIAARTFEALHREGISVSLISQSSSEQSICFAVPEAAARRARERLTEEFREQIARNEIDGVEVAVGPGHGGGGRHRHGRPPRHRGARVRRAGRGADQHRRHRPGLVGAEHLVRRGGQGRGGRAARGPRRLPAVEDRRRRRGPRPRTPTPCCSASARSAARWPRSWPRARARGTRTANPRTARRSCAWWRPSIGSGFVFDPNGLSPRAIAALVGRQGDGQVLAEVPGGRVVPPAEALALRWPSTRSSIRSWSTSPPTRPRRSSARRWARAWTWCWPTSAHLRARAPRARRWRRWRATPGRRILTEATVGAGLPIFDTYRKLVESGDRVLKIEGCLSGTLGFVLTEVETRAARSRRRSAARWSKGYTEPDPRDDLSGADVGRKALILGRLLGFAGEPADVAVESLVPAAMQALPPAAFLARLDDLDADWSRRAAAAKAKGGTLRYVASVTKNRISVGLKIVDRGEPLLRPQGDRQPGRLHHRPLPQEPAGHHRPRRRPGRHRRRRPQRHAPRQRLTARRSLAQKKREAEASRLVLLKSYLVSVRLEQVSAASVPVNWFFLCRRRRSLSPEKSPRTSGRSSKFLPTAMPSMMVPSSMAVGAHAHRCASAGTRRGPRG